MMEPDFRSTTLAQRSCQYELCIKMMEILAEFSGVSGYPHFLSFCSQVFPQLLDNCWTVRLNNLGSLKKLFMKHTTNVYVPFSQILILPCSLVAKKITLFTGPPLIIKGAVSS